MLDMDDMDPKQGPVVGVDPAYARHVTCTASVRNLQSQRNC
jgi:hypothetical protein